MSRRVASVVNWVALIVVIVVNGLANALPFNGQTTGEVSDKFPVYFVPAGYVFSIWGLIYLGLIVFAIYQALPSLRDNPALRAVDWLFPVNALANSIWMFCWHYELFTLTVLFMLVILGTLIAIYLRLGIGRKPVSTAERWCVHAPFSLYLGWVSVASVANITAWLYFIGWNGGALGPEVWAIVMFVIAGALAFLMGLTRGDWIYQLVVIWALVGIAVKQANTLPVAVVAGVVAALVAIWLVLNAVWLKRPARALTPTR